MLNVNLGCGQYPFSGFVNVDVLNCPEIWPQNFTGIDFIRHDFSKDGIPFEDNSIDFITAHHFLEHLIYEDGIKFVKECFDKLKIGGKLSLIVPDFEYFANEYVRGNMKPEECGFAFYPDAYSENMSEYHKALYDKHALERVARKAGFEKIHHQPISEFHPMVSHVNWQTGVICIK